MLIDSAVLESTKRHIPTCAEEKPYSPASICKFQSSEETRKRIIKKKKPKH